jgi:hypothetical protein
MHLTISGFRVIVNRFLDEIPTMELSKEVRDIIEPYNPEFVKETNKWMKDFFGSTNQVLVNKEQRTIFVGPRGLETIKKALGDNKNDLQI